MGGAIPRSFVGNAAWQYFATAATLGLGFVYSVLVARALGPGSLGVLAASTAFATVVYQVVELRLHEVVIRYLVLFEAEGDQASMVALARMSLVVDVATSVLAAIAAVALGRLLGPQAVRAAPGAVLVWATFGVLATNAGAATANGVLRVRGGFRAQALLRASASVLKLALTWVALRWFAAGILAVAVIATAVGAAASLAQLALSAQKLGVAHLRAGSLREAAARLRPHRRDIARFARSSWVISLTQIPTKDLDINLLAAFAPVETVGVYRVAKNFYAAAVASTDPLFYAVYPELARLWARSQGAALTRFLRRLTSLLAVATVGLVATLYVGVPLAVTHFMGASFDDASAMFRVMLLGLLVWSPFLWINPLMMAAGRPDITARGAMVGSVVSLLGYLVAVKVGAGGIGIAAVTGVVNAAVLAAIVAQGVRGGVFARLHTMRPAETHA